MNLSNFISYSYVVNFIFQDCIALADTICSFVSTFFTTYGDESSSSSFAFSVMMKSIFIRFCMMKFTIMNFINLQNYFDLTTFNKSIQLIFISLCKLAYLARCSMTDDELLLCLVSPVGD